MEDTWAEGWTMLRVFVNAKAVTGAATLPPPCLHRDVQLPRCVHII
jgi:hypothetical protein